MRASLQVLIAVIFIGVAFSAQAAVVINAVETGGDVVFTYSGTINQGGWELLPLGGDEFARIDPDNTLIVGPTPAVSVARFGNPTDFSGPDNFGTGPDAFATSGIGDIVGLVFASPILVVPGGYVRNTPISGTSIYEGETFASLGMALGSYTWSWDTRPFAAGTDSVTLNVVPIPAAAWLLGGGLIALLGLRRRFKN